MCDVVTEFGILNLMVIESGGAAPASPSPFTSPATKATPPTKPSTYERRQLLRKRDSSDALPSQTVLPPLISTPSLPTDSSIKSKANSVFSFDARRGSFASEIDGLSTREGEYVVPGRSPDFINAKFVATAEYWFHHVVEKVGEEHSNSVVRQTWIFDCRQTVNRIFENISRGRDGIGRFEAASPRVPYSMQADIGVDPDKCDVPDLLLVCMVQDVAVETLRFGFDPVGACPETLLKLGAFAIKSIDGLVKSKQDIKPYTNLYSLKEADLLKLTRASRLVHFVETPVLLFPKWRRKIAEVRGTVDTVVENRKSTIATGNYQQLPPPHPLISRRRANTLSVASSSVVAPSPFRFRSEDDDPCQVKILYMLMSDYISYLDTLGLRLFNVINIDKAGESHHMYKTEYPQGCRHAPHIALFKVMKGGIILVTLSFVQPYFIFNVNVWNPSDLTHALEKDEFCPDAIQQLRELEQSKDDLVMSCHLHSFTYDFHLRMLSKYLVGKDEDKEMLRIVLRDRRRSEKENQLNLVLYLITVATDNTSPLEGERHREDSRQSDVGEFRNVERRRDKDDEAAIEEMIGLVSAGVFPTIESTLLSRRRFSSGGHLQSSSAINVTKASSEAESVLGTSRADVLLKGAESDGDVHKVAVQGSAPRRHRKPAGSEGKKNMVEGRIVDDPASGIIVKKEQFCGQRRIAPMKSVIFSDDTKSNLDDPDGCNFYWRGLHNDFRHFNPKFLRRKCYDLERVQRYGTSRLGVCIDEDEQQGVPGCLRTSSRHDFPSFSIVSSTFQQNNAITDASRNGEIPGEHVTYVHFLSGRQRKLQKEVEDAVSQYSRQLRAAVDDAEWQCRRDHMWKKVLDPPSRARPTQSSGLSIFLTANPNRNPDPWHPLRTVSHETTRPAELETLITLVSKLPMEEREPRLTALLQGSNCARLCRFLFARFGPIRCRFFEFPHSLKKVIIHRRFYLSCFKIIFLVFFILMQYQKSGKFIII
uniref:DH domain-containing protein n=1 Tax=Heterorhabditis bacteriophora TaxID=37862 RepID=A0A1I7X9M9_HETBA